LKSIHTESEFDRDLFPGRPRILFIGWPESSHTHSWIDLLNNEALNIRLFCLPSQEPPADWHVKSYVTVPGAEQLNSGIRKFVFPPPSESPPPSDSSPSGADLSWLAKVKRILSRGSSPLPQSINKIEQAANLNYPSSIEAALAQVIETWQPDIIHTLGIDPASYLLKRTCDTFIRDHFTARWIVQARGGPDLAIKRFDPNHTPLIQEVIKGCDHFIADNEQNYIIAEELGLTCEKRENPGLGVVPGPGGLDLDELAALATGKPSERERVIIWPKAYEINSAKAMPVFEAIIKYWKQFQPCRIEMLWFVQADVQMWYEKLFPPEIKAHCPTFGRLSRQETLERIGKARVLLAPSLSDGIPNTMMEAMALGAVPIVSPLDTITPVVKNEVNVLFANNLYPDEIGSALVRLMRDDTLIDKMAENNRVRVQEMADRRKIRPRVITFYKDVARLAERR
jgi:glycosyltransferase involved in cell wall biosynthesis